MVESSLTLFWTRVNRRNESFQKFCRRYSEFDSNPDSPTSYGCLSSSVRSRTNLISKFCPIPEVCLRPSALNFSIIVWTSCSDIGTIHQLMRVDFQSRQQVCLNFDLHLLSSTSIHPGSNIHKWVREAWSAGLFESPGLDPLDDNELANLLQGSSYLHEDGDVAGCPSVAVHLILGDDLNPTCFMDSLKELIRIYGTMEMKDRIGVKRICFDSTRFDIDPCLVLIANCLLEYGCLNQLKVIIGMN